MRCSITLDADAIRHNQKVFQKLCPGAQAIAVVKSNAYGHGLNQVYAALEPLNLPWLGVNYLEEAAILRTLGYQGHILVVGPIRNDHLGWATELAADIFLGERSLVDDWRKSSKRPRAHLKIDTGMSRQGFNLDALPSVIEALKPQVPELYGICSHFANVEDVLDHDYGEHQLEAFAAAEALLQEAGFDLVPHMAASSSALLLEPARKSLVRIGISLYGLWPSRSTQLSFLQTAGSLVELKPALTWHTEVAIVKQVKAGQFIGYGCTYKALRDMMIAVLPVGYYEGYPRVASNRGHVLIQKQRCPIVGRICMNMMMVDISHLPPIEISTKVTLIGKDGKEQIDAAQVGEWADTIHYELLTRLNPIIPRHLKP